MSRRLPVAASARLLDILAHTEWAEQSAEHDESVDNLVRDCLEAMSRRDRDLLLAYFYERLTYRQLAERFGWHNKGSAHWHVRQALGRLRERLEKINGPRT